MNATRLSAVKRLGALPVVGLVATVAALAPMSAAAATWTGASPTVDGVSGAPWNPSQGVPYFDGNTVASYPLADLLPSFSFAGQAASATTSQNGVTPTSPATTITEPNVAVYPTGTTSASEPFASGYVGTPGPLSGYCPSSETDLADDNDAPNFTNPLGTSANVPLTEPSGELPFSPYYFPQIVETSGATSTQDLTGYFDWRPKDGDEAIVVADSTDGGKTWTFEGKALDQNGTYCPSADTNDDGQGHPFVANFGTASALYTLQRAAGDYAGTNLLVNPVDPSAADPLSGDPASASIGVDPNTFATSSTQLSAVTPVSIPVSTLGGDSTYGNSTNSLVSIPDVSALPNGAAKYEDITAGNEASGGTTPPVITCTGTSGSTGSSPALTGCTSPAGINVGVNDDLVEVIGTASAAGTVPVGPNNQSGSGGLSAITLVPTSTNADTLTYLLNNNAPNRYYIDGHVVYCTQGNAEPTTKIEDCTTTSSSPFQISAGDPIIADPIIPTASNGGPTTQTNGLISPDGIIGSLPSSANSAWSEPSTGHVVLYTEKLVNYFIEGGINGTVLAANASSYTNYKSDTAGSFVTSQTGTSATLQSGYVPAPGSTPTDYNISPFPTESEKLPATGSFDVYIGAQTASSTGGPASSGAAIDTLLCTGWDVNTHIADLYNPNLNTIDLTGCTGGTGTQTTSGSGSTEKFFIGSDGFTAGHQGNWVAGPGAAIELANGSGKSVLQQIGEGKAITTGQAQKLFGNNEDYEAVRAAYTTDGVNFTDLGPISGSTSGALGNTAGASQTCPALGGAATSVTYADLSDPCQQDAPAGNPSTGGDAANANIDPANPQGDAPTSLPAGTADTTELRWPGARGTIVINPDGTIGLFLSGAWPSDGDSDAFNQTFYTESSNGGKSWSVPTVVESTDYDFSASVAQDASLAANGPGSAPGSNPLGVSAYYSGRAYDPTVVQNANGTLTLVFAGYRLPNPVKAAGSFVGTNTSGTNTGVTPVTSTTQYEEGATPAGSTAFETDPAIYRNILTTTLTQTPAALISEWRPAGPGGTAGDDYVDVANNGAAALGLTGWTLKFADTSGNTYSVALSGSVPVNGHLLAADSGYSLTGTAAPDVSYAISGLTGNPVGVQLLNPAGDVVDAVGFTGAPAGFYEGTKLAIPASYPTGQFAWVRNYSDGSLANSESNASDFTYVATSNVGQPGYGAPTAGDPGPLDLGSPTSVNSFLAVSTVDPSVAPGASPNTIYDGASGALDVNFTVTNCSGEPATGVCVNAATTSAYTVKALQFRLTTLTTGTLSAVTSAGGTYSDGQGGSVSVQGLTLAPPASGTGGLNSVLVGTADLPQGGLNPGESVNVQFQFDAPPAPTHFQYNFGFNTEDDFVPAATVAAGGSGSGTTAPSGSGVTPAPSASATPIVPTVSGTVGPTGVTVVVHPATKTHTTKKAKKHQHKHTKHKAKKHVKKKARKHVKKKATKHTKHKAMSGRGAH